MTMRAATCGATLAACTFVLLSGGLAAAPGTGHAAPRIGGEADRPWIEVGNATGYLGEVVDLPVIFRANGQLVAEVFVELELPSEVRPLIARVGRPDCVVNPVIMKSQTYFYFVRDDCEGDECRTIRALVTDLANSAPIPDGAVLFTCRSRLVSPVPDGVPVACSQVGCDDTVGFPVECDCASGSIASVEETPSPTPVATPSPPDVVFTVGSVSGFPGDEVDVPVFVDPSGWLMSSMSITPLTEEGGGGFLAAEPGTADCVLGPSLMPSAVRFSMNPECGPPCRGVTAEIDLPLSPEPLAADTELFRCRFRIADEASGVFRLDLLIPNYRDAAGVNHNAKWVGGELRVGGPASPTMAAIDSTTPTATPTATPEPTTPEPSATVTSPPPACAGDCDGDGQVHIAELVRAVEIALSSAGLTTCERVDADGDGSVQIGELVAAVGAALGGCSLD